MSDDGYFDAEVARRYDLDHGGNDPQLIRQTVDLIDELAGQKPILEFAIGTGRIALPLAKRSRVVKGIELSSAMVAELRKKETSAPLDVKIGDITRDQMPGAFSLVFLIFNTIDNLTSQQDQLACFENAARHLCKGGRFLIEAQLPPLQRLPFGETNLSFANAEDHSGFDEIDVATQKYTSHHIWKEQGKERRQSMPFRYAWPAEIDLMARIAGLELEHRWADWDKRRYDRFAHKHISVWKKPVT